MSKTVQQIERNRLARFQNSYWEDFNWYISPHLWTTTASDGGAASVGDAHAGILTITPSDGSVTDNDETYVKTTNELFLLDADNTMRFGALIKYTEANVDDANVMFGVCNAVGANTIVDNGAGPVASFSGAVIYKVDGGTVWRCCSSIATTRTDTVTAVSSISTAYQLLEIEFLAISLTNVKVHFFINGAAVLDPNASYPRPLEHTLDATSATEMQLFVGQKTGDITNVESLLVDGMGWDIIR